MRAAKMNPVKRLCVRFSGRVQGVGFRATAQYIARQFSVTGWVRNDPDGTVLMEIEGTFDEIERCLDMLVGRMGSFITSTSRTDIPPVGDTGFEMRFDHQPGGLLR